MGIVLCFHIFVGWDLGQQIGRAAFECSTVFEFLATDRASAEKWKNQDKETYFQDVIFSQFLGWVN